MNSTLRFAALLSAGGGFLDSYAWVAHGHVFTNAQTGNIILFGVFAAQDEWRQALQSSGFQRVGKWSYTSAVTTANLRSLGETLFAIMFLPHNPEASDQARTMAAICAFFVCSATAGATLTVIFGKSAIVSDHPSLHGGAVLRLAGARACKNRPSLFRRPDPSLVSTLATSARQASHPSLAVEMPDRQRGIALAPGDGPFDRTRSASLRWMTSAHRLDVGST